MLIKKTFNWTEIGDICNLWRLYDDIDDSWQSVLSIINYWGTNQDMLIPAAKPGAWNDPDMLIVGDYSLSEGEAQVQFALWAIFAAPLYISADVRTMADQYRAILLNKEIIAVNQDPLGKQGRRLSNTNGHQVWYRKISNGAVAVALLNTNTDGIHAQLSVDFSAIGMPASAAVRDLYQQKDLGTFKGSFSTFVNPHGVAMVKITSS